MPIEEAAEPLSQPVRVRHNVVSTHNVRLLKEILYKKGLHKGKAKSRPYPSRCDDKGVPKRDCNSAKYLIIILTTNNLIVAITASI